MSASLSQDPPISSEQDYDQLLAAMRDFLATFTLDNHANRIRAIPTELTDRKAQVSFCFPIFLLSYLSLILTNKQLNQVRRYWIPALNQLFGNLDQFFGLLLATDEGRKALENHFEATRVPKELQQLLIRFAHPLIVEYYKQGQAVGFVNSVLVFFSFLQMTNLFLFRSTIRLQY